MLAFIEEHEGKKVVMVLILLACLLWPDDPPGDCTKSTSRHTVPARCHSLRLLIDIGKKTNKSQRNLSFVLVSLKKHRESLIELLPLGQGLHLNEPNSRRRDKIEKMAPTIETSEDQARCPISFQRMLDDIRGAFERPDCRVDVDELWRVLDSYKSHPIDWSKYAHYDPRKYKRNLVDDHEKYNVMILSWAPNTRSCIHDHSGSHCFMKMLDGELIESRFAWPDEHQIVQDGEMSKISDSKMEVNDVLYINDKVGLHRVENASATRTAASLHVYIPPFRKCKVFDQRTGQARDCKLTFYSKKGKIIKEDEESIRPK